MTLSGQGGMRRTLMLALVMGSAALLAGSTGGASAQDAPPEIELDFTGRVQVQFSTTSVDEEDAGVDLVGSTWETRRVRFGIEMSVGEWVHGKLEPDYALGQLKLADAWAAFDLHDAVRLKVGQFKLPFSLLELTSSTTYPTIERGIRIRGVEEMTGRLGPSGLSLPGEEQELLGTMGYLGRDIGAMVIGRFGRFGVEAGFFNGQGQDSRDVNDAKTVAGRLTFTPSARLPLVVGGAAIRRDVSAFGEDDEGWGFEVDAEWGSFRAPGLHLMAEGTLADHLETDDQLLGAQAIAAYYVPLTSPRLAGLELVGRVSWGDPLRDLEDDEGALLTPGVNLYVSGRNRLMLNWDVYLPAADALDTVHALRAQTQLYF